MLIHLKHEVRLILGVALAICVLPGIALAGPLSDVSGSTFPSVLRLLAAFAVTILLLFGLRHVLRRMSNPKGATSQKLMNVVEVLPIGPKAKLVTVRVGDRMVVVGTGESSVSHITDIAMAEYDAFMSESDTNVVPFKDRLLRMARK